MKSPINRVNFIIQALSRLSVIALISLEMCKYETLERPAGGAWLESDSHHLDWLIWLIDVIEFIAVGQVIESDFDGVYTSISEGLIDH
jgi:hypothetical protein